MSSRSKLYRTQKFNDSRYTNAFSYTSGTDFDEGEMVASQLLTLNVDDVFVLLKRSDVGNLFYLLFPDGTCRWIAAAHVVKI